MTGLREQLAPGWSSLNIAIIVILLLTAWPLALLMIAYIIWGAQVGLDLSQPGSIGAFTRRISSAWKAAVQAFKQHG